MSAILGAGSVLQLNIASVLTTQANVTSISGASMTVDDVETTILTSPSVFKEFIAGFGDGGEVTVGCRFNAAGFNTLLTNIRVMNVWRILLSNGSHMDFSGYIKGLALDTPLEEDITQPFTIKVTGLPTFTP